MHRFPAENARVDLHSGQYHYQVDTEFFTGKINNCYEKNCYIKKISAYYFYMYTKSHKATQAK